MDFKADEDRDQTHTCFWTGWSSLDNNPEESRLLPLDFTSSTTMQDAKNLYFNGAPELRLCNIHLWSVFASPHKMYLFVFKHVHPESSAPALRLCKRHFMCYSKSQGLKVSRSRTDFGKAILPVWLTACLRSLATDTTHFDLWPLKRNSLLNPHPLISSSGARSSWNVPSPWLSVASRLVCLSPVCLYLISVLSVYVEGGREGGRVGARCEVISGNGERWPLRGRGGARCVFCRCCTAMPLCAQFKCRRWF